MHFEINDPPPAIRRWLELAKARDAAALDDLLAEEVVFESPVVSHAAARQGDHESLSERGARRARQRDLPLCRLLARRDIRRCWSSRSTIDGVEIDGVDMIGWNAEDRIVVVQGDGAAVERPRDACARMMAARLEAMKPR